MIHSVPEVLQGLRKGPLSLMNTASDLPYSSPHPEALVPVFIPSLASLLVRAESLKGADLTEPEALAIRDGAIYMMMSRERAQAMNAGRGYDDLDPENVWQSFLDLKRSVSGALHDTGQ